MSQVLEKSQNTASFSSKKKRLFRIENTELFHTNNRKNYYPNFIFFKTKQFGRIANSITAAWNFRLNLFVYAI